jgi:hypothetical protein
MHGAAWVKLEARSKTLAMRANLEKLVNFIVVSQLISGREGRTRRQNGNLR